MADLIVPVSGPSRRKIDPKQTPCAASRRQLVSHHGRRPCAPEPMLSSTRLWCDDASSKQSAIHVEFAPGHVEALVTSQHDSHGSDFLGRSEPP